MTERELNDYLSAMALEGEATIIIDEPVPARLFLNVARGHGKTTAVRKWEELEAAMRELYPPVPPAEVIGNLNVRWSCLKPTDAPPPAVATPLWMNDQAHDDILQVRKKFGDVIALMKAAGL